MAAISAAKGGAETIMVDRDLAGLDHTANTLFEGMASASGVKVEDCYLKKELDGMSILSPSGQSACIPAKGYFIDRKRFDEHYLSLAQSSGVALLAAAAGKSRTEDGSRIVSLNEKMDASADEIEARIVVDASGISSGLSRQAGLVTMRHPEDIAWAMEADIEHPGLGEEMFFQYWIGSMAPGWKATFSPAGGDRATLGVFVRGHGGNVQPYFRNFLKLFKAYKASQYRDIEKLKILSVRRGGDPICVLPGEIVADSLMVTGGAAGQSGLAYGMRAGTICGSVAAEAVLAGDVSRRALCRYEQLWKREFYWQYRMGRASLQTLSKMTDSEIDRLVRGLSGKRLISEGSFAKKAAYAAGMVLLTRPRTALDLAVNLMRG
ncbi:MAG: Digeranylgeranylglycerophospholipid reductase [Methanosaeta sp. PtaU1.Bin112]|nr:MAG: Digeranylgeranylglycerophospholipid reductase [Methanosaeta sp. PtaU1.Bin112]